MNKQSFFTKTSAVWLLGTLCCLLWGSAFPVIKIGYQLLGINSDDTATIILFAGLRFTLAGVLTILIFSIISKKLLLPSKSSMPKISLLALLQTVLQYLFFYVGLANTTGVRSSIIDSVSVFLSIFISCLIFKMEKLTPTKIIGSVIGFAGVILVNLNGLEFNSRFAFNGEGFIFLSATFYALSSVFMKKLSKDENPALLSGYQFFFGGIIMIVAGLLMGGKINGFDAKSIVLLLYLALLSAVAYTVWGMLLKYNPVSKVSVCSFLIPVFGSLLSVVLLGESTGLGVEVIIALVLVAVGVYVVNINKKDKKI